MFTLILNGATFILCKPITQFSDLQAAMKAFFVKVNMVDNFIFVLLFAELVLPYTKGIFKVIIAFMLWSKVFKV